MWACLPPVAPPPAVPSYGDYGLIRNNTEHQLTVSAEAPSEWPYVAWYRAVYARFDLALADCRARRKAAIMKARREVERG